MSSKIDFIHYINPQTSFTIVFTIELKNKIQNIMEIQINFNYILFFYLTLFNSIIYFNQLFLIPFWNMFSKPPRSHLVHINQNTGNLKRLLGLAHRGEY